MFVVFECVVLIGFGLIVGFMLFVMWCGKLVGEIVGYVCLVEICVLVCDINLVDCVCDIVEDVVKDVDFVVLCVFVGVMEVVFKVIVLYLKLGVIVLDVGLVKWFVFEVVVLYMFDGVYFIGVYFMVGIEYLGLYLGFVMLFDNCWCLIVLFEVVDQFKVD